MPRKLGSPRGRRIVDGLGSFYSADGFAGADMRSVSAADMNPRQLAWSAAVLAAMNFVRVWQDCGHGDMDPTELLALLSHELPGVGGLKVHRPPD